MIVWLTGQPGSGKTTIANYLFVDHVIDGDHLRSLQNPGYDEAGRRQNVDRAQAIAAYISSYGSTVAVAVVAPYADQRDAFRNRFDVLQVYLHGREPTEYWVEDYEVPTDSTLAINTGRIKVEEAVRLIHRAMATTTRRTHLADSAATGQRCACFACGTPY